MTRGVWVRVRLIDGRQWRQPDGRGPLYGPGSCLDLDEDHAAWWVSRGWAEYVDNNGTKEGNAA